MVIASQILAHLLFIYLAVIELALGPRVYREIVRLLGRWPEIRPRVYWLLILGEWLLSLTVAVILIPIPRPLHAIGLVVPTRPALAWTVTVALTIVIGGSTWLTSRNPQKLADIQADTESLAPLLPVTLPERRLFAGLSISAGICEEIIFRGYLFLYLMNLGLPQIGALVLGAAIFGLDHAYQGYKAVLQVTVLALAFGLLYILTSSILPGMFIHTLIDLRVLLLWQPTARPEPVHA